MQYRESIETLVSHGELVFTFSHVQSTPPRPPACIRSPKPKLLPNKGCPALTAPSAIRELCKRPETCMRLKVVTRRVRHLGTIRYGRAPEPYTRLFSDSKSMRTCDCTIHVESFLPAHVDRSAIWVFLQAKAPFCGSDFPRVPALRSSLAVAATRCPAVSI
jgi:hypothetical protein